MNPTQKIYWSPIYPMSTWGERLSGDWIFDNVYSFPTKHEVLGIIGKSSVSKEEALEFLYEEIENTKINIEEEYRLIEKEPNKKDYYMDSVYRMNKKLARLEEAKRIIEGMR